MVQHMVAIWWVVEGKFSVSFGPKLPFRLWIWTKPNNEVGSKRNL